MKIFSETGFLIVMDPAYLKEARYDQAKRIDFLQEPETAANKLEQHLFPDGYGGLIGLAALKEGAGNYKIDITRVDFWDVDTEGNKVIFGVDLGSFIIFDILYIHPIIQYFDTFEFENNNHEEYFNQLRHKIANGRNVLIWTPSPLPFAEGWHEIDVNAFQKIE